MPKRAPSKTMARTNEDLKRVLSEILRGMKDPRLQQGLVTVTRVEAASDLSTAKVFVSVLAGEEEAEAVLSSLARARGHVRSEVAARMHIRRAPELLFTYDGNAAYADHINTLLRGLTHE